MLNKGAIAKNKEDKIMFIGNGSVTIDAIVLPSKYSPSTALITFALNFPSEYSCKAGNKNTNKTIVADIIMMARILPQFVFDV